MNRKETSQSIKEARTRFEKDLKKAEYARITSNEEQLQEIFTACNLHNKVSYLDIGTGRGYVAFAVSHECPESTVIGIDIVQSVLKLNEGKAKQSGFQNITFNIFDGIHLPFEKNSFDGIFSRYSFHHFPYPEETVKSIGTVLKKDGFCFISDPTLFDNDCIDFANKYSSLREDGHIKYYTRKEMEILFQKNNMMLESVFYSEVTIPRELTQEYEELVQNTPDEIKTVYRITIENNKIAVTVPVMNILFRKIS